MDGPTYMMALGSAGVLPVRYVPVLMVMNVFITFLHV